MSRTPSAAALKAMFARNSGDAWIALVRISHPSMAVPICLANNPQDVASGGETYVKCHFEVALPEDSESVPRVRLRIVNVAREQTEWIRSIRGEPEVQVFWVLASQPDTVDVGPYVFQLKSVTWDALFIEGELGVESFLHEPVPGWTITPDTFPGMY